MMLNELENLCGNIQKIAHISFSVNKMVNGIHSNQPDKKYPTIL